MKWTFQELWNFYKENALLCKLYQICKKKSNENKYKFMFLLIILFKFMFNETKEKLC